MAILEGKAVEPLKEQSFTHVGAFLFTQDKSPNRVSVGAKTFQATKDTINPFLCLIWLNIRCYLGFRLQNTQKIGDMPQKRQKHP